MGHELNRDMGVAVNLFNVSLRTKITCVILLSFLQLSCSSGRLQVPVISRTEPLKEAPEIHVVRTGETLYTIVKRYGQDLAKVASANRLKRPYTIYPGQKLRLPNSRSRLARVVYLRPTATPPSSQRQTTGVESRLSAGRPKTRATTQTGKRLWRWPASGQLLTRFSRSQSAYKGVAIGGRIGEPVMATSSGEVVYSGHGLAGYGNLLIIKHNAGYLSAYGHNRVLLVKEGDRVKSGQKIAELGSTGTSEPKLYFEIRRYGKPVDPLAYLPKR